MAIMFKQFEAILSAKFNSRIDALQTDNAGEMVSKECQSYLASRGIHHRTTTAYDSQSNGTAERLNRSIMDIAEAIRIRAGLCKGFWPLCVRHAAYLLNRLPHTALNKLTPY